MISESRRTEEKAQSTKGSFTYYVSHSGKGGGGFAKYDRSMTEGEGGGRWGLAKYDLSPKYLKILRVGAKSLPRRRRQIKLSRIYTSFCLSNAAK